MTTLTVWKYDTVDGADKALAKLLELQKELLVEVVDAATVTWAPGHKKPTTRQLVPTTALGALDGAFWGMLFGFLFFMPLVGAAVGSLIGGLSGHFADYGIDDEFIKKVRTQVTEGKSALFLLTGKVTEDKVAEAFKDMEKGELIKSSLTHEQEEKLRADFCAVPAKQAAKV
ncbi:MAG: DUF1269 domain-containing protein [Candidatus Obscuribacterales bacterium]|nr:DUF1269 domain-containing protein [Cyanobacteria bacterium SZAS LIN-5]RTL43730.1 MAG: DUF1269 domain-containing protein [Candidatus Melainabacteria bacterium]